MYFLLRTKLNNSIILLNIITDRNTDKLKFSTYRKPINLISYFKFSKQDYCKENNINSKNYKNRQNLHISLNYF